MYLQHVTINLTILIITIYTCSYHYNDHVNINNKVLYIRMYKSVTTELNFIQ